MPTIREYNIDDLIASLGDWRDYSATPVADLFIGAIGFEDRSSICFSKWCSAASGRKRHALLVCYPFNAKENELQAERFRESAREAGVDPILIPYENLTIFGEVLRHVRENTRLEHVMLDISSMASFAFYPVMSAVLEGATGACLSVCYTEAEEYFPSNEEWSQFQAKAAGLDMLERARLFDESHFQSRGVESVFEALNFTGRNIDNLPSKLIVVPNFSFERVNRMIDHAVSRYHIERGTLEWIIGMPPDQARNGWRYDALWEMYSKPNSKRDASTLNYKEMISTLHDIWWESFQSQSLVIATVGSKAQHLGTLLFLLMHSDVGLVLAEPREFTASRYSAKAGRCWSLDFGKVCGLVSKLKQWNRLSFDWV